MVEFLRTYIPPNPQIGTYIYIYIYIENHRGVQGGGGAPLHPWHRAWLTLILKLNTTNDTMHGKTHWLSYIPWFAGPLRRLP